MNIKFKFQMIGWIHFESGVKMKYYAIVGSKIVIEGPFDSVEKHKDCEVTIIEVEDDSKIKFIKPKVKAKFAIDDIVTIRNFSNFTGRKATIRTIIDVEDGWNYEVGIDGLRHIVAEKHLVLICEKCGSVKGKGSIKVLGCGGDYETWPCDICCPEEYHKSLMSSYSHGGYDGEAD